MVSPAFHRPLSEFRIIVSQDLLSGDSFFKTSFRQEMTETASDWEPKMEAGAARTLKRSKIDSKEKGSQEM